MKFQKNYEKVQEDLKLTNGNVALQRIWKESDNGMIYGIVWAWDLGMNGVVSQT